MANGDVIAECREVSRTFVVGSDVVHALTHVDFAAPAGSVVAVSGPSGSGKSTLLALIGCLARPDEGTVELLGSNVGGLSRRARRDLRRTTVATVLAEPADNLLLHRTGTANIEVAARWRRSDRRKVDSPVDMPVDIPVEAMVEAVIVRLAIASFVDRTCSVMSGGEQQRVALACALVGATPLVIADEPTAALDAVSASDVIGALRAAAEAGSAVVVATHDPNVIAAADTFVRLEHGRTVACRHR